MRLLAAFQLAVLCLCGLLAVPAHARPLNQVLAGVSNESASTEQRYAAFLELISDVDALVASRPDKTPALSRCSAFSFLYSTLYQLDGHDLERTLEDASLFIGTTPVIFGTMVHDSRFLVGPLDPMKQRLAHVLTTAYNRGSGEAALSPAALFAKVKGELSGRHYAKDWRDFQNKAVARMAGLGDTKVELPLWLTTHSGVGLASNANPDDDRQNRGWGYLQLTGDHDGTGRHDHLLGTMMLGYSAEKARMSKLGIEAASSGQVCASDLPLPLRPLYWIGKEEHDAYNFVRPANWLYTSVRKTAPWAEEHLAPGQNGSPTDSTVNKRGQALGAKLAHRANALSQKDFNQAVYSAICDESEIEPTLHGPISAEGLALLSDRTPASH